MYRYMYSLLSNVSGSLLNLFVCNSVDIDFFYVIDFFQIFFFMV